MENSKEINNKLDQLIDLSLRTLIFSMYKEGQTIDEICKNLHLSSKTAVKLLSGLKKNK